MELGAIFLVLAVLILVGMYLYAPFMSSRRRKATQESHETSALLAERDRVINSLQELDFDFSLGKIPAEDYPVQRSALLQKGAEVLKQLDELTLTSSNNGRGGSEEDRIEKAVAARRADASAKAAEITDDDIESMIVTRRTSRQTKSAGFCPRCGKPVLDTDRFCPSCGKSLT